MSWSLRQISVQIYRDVFSASYVDLAFAFNRIIIIIIIWLLLIGHDAAVTAYSTSAVYGDNLYWGGEMIPRTPSIGAEPMQRVPHLSSLRPLLLLILMITVAAATDMDRVKSIGAHGISLVVLIVGICLRRLDCPSGRHGHYSRCHYRHCRCRELALCQRLQL